MGKNRRKSRMNKFKNSINKCRWGGKSENCGGEEQDEEQDEQVQE